MFLVYLTVVSPFSGPQFRTKGRRVMFLVYLTVVSPFSGPQFRTKGREGHVSSVLDRSFSIQRATVPY